jgi:succinate-semialdehyde dehydrogenase/glutarate-semialdehyde dehydrogenase
MLRHNTGTHCRRKESAVLMSTEVMENQKTPSLNPTTGEIFGYTEENTITELNDAVTAAHTAQKEWALRSFSERKKHLYKVRSFIVENADRIAEVISTSMGKTRMDAMSTEVLPAAMAITFYCKAAPKFLKKKHLRGGSILTINKRSVLEHVPFGVIGIISPWNYPFGIPFHEVTMALIAGNGVVLKVATQVQEVGNLIRESIGAGEFPKGLFSLINLPGSVAGRAFVEAGIDKLFFTGSTEVGKSLMAIAAERLIPVSLELGGNDAMIVCNDANPVKAVGGAMWAGLSNCGQSCAGVERIYVEEGIYDEFTSLLKKRVAELRQGVDTDFNIEISSLSNESQLNRVKELVQDAISKGASTTWNDRFESAKGFFHKVVIIENANDSMRMMNEEVFGPVLAVQKVKNIYEAIRLANNSTMGLTASVWTENKRKAKMIASQLEVGSVMINDHLMSHGLAETPWGGFKQSSIGRTHSHIGLEEMTQPRVVIKDILPFLKKNMWWYPHNRSVYDGLKGGLYFLYSKNLVKRITGGVKLVKTFMRSFVE